MEIFAVDYDTEEQADSAIAAGVMEYYNDYFPETVVSNKSDIEQAIAGMKDLYSKNIFPYMKASWNVYPDQIGHMEYNGCFRCHNDRHEAADGSLISKD